MSDFLRVLALFRPYVWWMLAGFALSLATLLSNVALLALSGWFIAAMAVAGAAHLDINYFFPSAGIRLFAIMRTAGRYCERLVTHEASLRLLSLLRVRLYERIEPLAPARLEEYRGGDLLSRMGSDVDTLENVYLRLLVPAATAFFGSIVGLLFVSRYSTVAAADLAGFLLVAGLVVPLAARKMGAKPGKGVAELSSRLRTAVVDGIQGLDELLVYGAEERQGRMVDGLSRRMCEELERLGRIGALTVAATAFLNGAALWSLLLIAVPLVNSRAITGPDLVMLALFIPAIFEAIAPLPAAFQALGQTMASARRIFELLDAKPAVGEPLTPSPLPEDSSVSFSGVVYAYPGQGRPAVREVDLTIPAGKSLAVVGGSGAGKSTLASLLLRFRDPDQGRVMLGGHDLRDFTTSDLRSRIAVVSQATHLFNASIRDNLLIAKPEATEEQLVAAARRALIHDFIASQPEGYDTQVGEGGLKLSGGQARRLAVARALLKDTPVLILDEPGEGLDPETERELMAHLLDLSAGKTVLLITHRLTGLDRVDRVALLDAGRISAVGTHAELLAASENYRRMAELTASF